MTTLKIIIFIKTFILISLSSINYSITDYISTVSRIGFVNYYERIGSYIFYGILNGNLTTLNYLQELLKGFCIVIISSIILYGFLRVIFGSNNSSSIEVESVQTK